jgi:two-component system sensor histidine kinase CpxA
MEREVERLNALITQLLTLSRLEALDQPPPMESIDLIALVREVAADADFEATSVNRGVRLEASEPCEVKGARDLLRSAIENVVRNALRYTVPESEVLIRLARTAGGQTVTLIVEDHGPGVPPEALEHMFEPFYRVDEARDRRSGGTGLGLAIAHHIVTVHGGSVSAANRSGEGLEMRISLPCTSAQRPALDQKTA